MPKINEDGNKMRIHLSDTSGQLVGYVIGYTVYNLEGKKIQTVKPTTTLERVVQFLLKDKTKNYVS